MKIKNELVSIKIGKKQYDFNNLILDEYLKRLVRSQLDEKDSNLLSVETKARCCLIKFDEEFKNLSPKSELQNTDFDIGLLGSTIANQDISEQKISTEYLYSSDYIWDYNKKTGNVKISDYYGKKITAIGFNSWWGRGTVLVMAVLDVSNYNIYLQENQELSVTRKDIITTDALFYSNDKTKVPGPVHLAPYGVPQIIYQPNIYENENSWKSFNDTGYGILYSIGLSSYSDYIDREFVIGKDVQIKNNGTELEIQGIENYLSNDDLIFPHNNIYPNSALYPIKSNYKYVIFKYKVWQLVHSGTYDNTIETPTDTGYFYYQAIPIDKFGKSNIKIKYERG